MIMKEPPKQGLAGLETKKTGIFKDPPRGFQMPERKASVISEGTIADFGSWTLDENGLLDIAGSGDMPDYERYPWGAARCETKEIRIRSGITSIGKFAFQGFVRVSRVIIADSVKSIGMGSFYYCNMLTDITLPKELTEIGNGAFANCFSLIHITLPNKLASIGYKSFCLCFNLEKINIPPSVEHIGKIAFLGCPFSQDAVKIEHQGEIENFGRWELDALDRLYITGTGKMPSFDTCPWDEYEYDVKTVDIRGNVTEIHSIPRGAYRVSLPKSLTSIARRAFSDCEFLTHINIPDGVTYIGEDAFSGCKNLTDITIPGSVVEIEEGAFVHCERLTCVTIPDGVRYLGRECFYGCNSLTYVKLPFSLISLPKGALMSCPNLKTLIHPTMLDFHHGSGEYIPKETQWEKLRSEEENNPYSIVANDYFEVYNPNSTSPFGDHLYWTLYQNGTMHLSSNTDVWMNNYTKLESRPWHSVKDQIKEVVIDSVIHQIGDYTFAQCPNLKRVFIPSCTTIIGQSAFENCPKLSQVVWVSSNDAFYPPKDGTISTHAFANCSSLTSIEIPSSIKSLSNAFSGCTALKKANLPKHLKPKLFGTKSCYGLPNEIVMYF